MRRMRLLFLGADASSDLYASVGPDWSTWTRHTNFCEPESTAPANDPFDHDDGRRWCRDRRLASVGEERGNTTTDRRKHRTGG